MFWWIFIGFKFLWVEQHFDEYKTSGAQSVVSLFNEEMSPLHWHSISTSTWEQEADRNRLLAWKRPDATVTRMKLKGLSCSVLRINSGHEVLYTVIVTYERRIDSGRGFCLCLFYCIMSSGPIWTSLRRGRTWKQVGPKLNCLALQSPHLKTNYIGAVE